MRFLPLLVLVTAPALAADTLAVQGRLTNLGGGVDGDYPMAFRLYESATGLAPHFQEIEVAVSVVDGVFSTVIGDGVALGLDHMDRNDLWLEVIVGGEPPLPRVQLSLTARSFVAMRSHDVACTGCITPEETSFMACPDESILVKSGGAWACAPRPSGKQFALSDQVCAVGQVIRGFKADGTATCVSDSDTTYSGANFAVSGTGCPAGQVMTGVASDGAPTCGPDKDTTYSGANFALSGNACAAGSVVTGIDASGKPTCAADKDTKYDGGDFALSNKSCAAGSVVKGIDATGNVVCETNPAYTGSNFALSGKSCTAGSVVKGIDASGNPLCEANPTYDGGDFALANKSCGTNQVQKGVDANGNPVCVTDANTTYSGNNFATSGQACGANQFVSGISASGAVVCGNLRDYVNSNCHVYFGWSDSCDGCTTAPVKAGYANSTGCGVTGGDSSCVTTTLNGKSVRLIGVNTDGDVNGDDKFYVGWRCD